MKIFLTDNLKNAIKARQLINFDSECGSLCWSDDFHSNLDENVIEALDTIQEFINKEIEYICEDSILDYELTETEEYELVSLLKENITLKKILGSGVVLIGDETKEVLTILESLNKLSPLINALHKGKNLILI